MTNGCEVKVILIDRMREWENGRMIEWEIAYFLAELKSELKISNLGFAV